MTSPTRAVRIALAILLPVVLTAGCRDATVPAAPAAPGAAVPGVTGLRAENDPVLWGTVHFRWDALPASPEGLPVLGYQLVLVTDPGGDPDAKDGGATVLRDVPAAGKVMTAATCDTRDGITAGVAQTFAVRPFYGAGAGWGPAARLTWTATPPHRRGGRVLDEQGRPLAGVVVRIQSPGDVADARGFRAQAVTNAAGRFAPLGPVAGDVPLVLETVTPDVASSPGAADAYFDYRTEPLPYAPPGRDVTIYLLPRCELAPGMMDVRNTNFVKVLQDLTLSDGRARWEGPTVMRKWGPEEFPLPVLIPAGTNLAGTIDLAEVAAGAVEHLNGLFAVPLFVLTQDPAETVVRFDFTTWNNAAIVAPTPKGSVRPQYATVRLNKGEENRPRLESAAVHELCHVLMYSRHNPNFYGVMGSGTGALQPDEVRVLRALRHLPGEHFMSGYENSFPDDTTW